MSMCLAVHARHCESEVSLEMTLIAVYLLCQQRGRLGSAMGGSPHSRTASTATASVDPLNTTMKAQDLMQPAGERAGSQPKTTTTATSAATIAAPLPNVTTGSDAEPRSRSTLQRRRGSSVASRRRSTSGGSGSGGSVGRRRASRVSRRRRSSVVAEQIRQAEAAAEASGEGSGSLSDGGVAGYVPSKDIAFTGHVLGFKPPCGCVYPCPHAIWYPWHGSVGE